MNTSEQTNELFAALAKAQGEIESAKADGFNKHLNAAYSTIDALLDAIKGPCSKNGLAIMQVIHSVGDDYVLETRVAHSSGQWLQTEMKLLLAKRDMQSLGSASTYGKRYSIEGLLAISTEISDAKVTENVQRASNHAQFRAASKAVIAETKKTIVNHAEGEIAKAAEASKNPKTGTIGVTKLVENLNKPEPKMAPPADGFRFSWGKHFGKTIADIGISEAKSYLEFMLKEANKHPTRPLDSNVAAFKAAVEAYK